MDMRLIFLNLHVGFEAGCRRRVVTGVNGYPLYGLLKAGSSLRFIADKAMCPSFPEKRPVTETQAVPKPTQVGGYKDTKARERNLVKELGNIAP